MHDKKWVAFKTFLSFFQKKEERVFYPKQAQQQTLLSLYLTYPVIIYQLGFGLKSFNILVIDIK